MVVTRGMIEIMSVTNAPSLFVHTHSGDLHGTDGTQS
jgi:hypothetical protein